jgi:two-component system CheB/CheR fusion protein
LDFPGSPGISGYDVARHLRGQEATASALLIVVTGYGQAEDSHSAKVAGFDRHLVKPLRFGELLALIAPAAAPKPAGRTSPDT